MTTTTYLPIILYECYLCFAFVFFFPDSLVARLVDKKNNIISSRINVCVCVCVSFLAVNLYLLFHVMSDRSR